MKTLRRIKTYFVIGILIFLIGFAQSNNTYAQKLPPLLKTGEKDLSAFNIEDLKTLITDYKSKSVGSDDEKEAARIIRNRLIATGTDQIDAYFNNFQKHDRRKREWLQFFLDFMEIAASTAISITNGERAKSLISEGLGALQGSRTSLNKNFKLLERQILINKMVADRANVLTLILNKLNEDVSQYPWEAARSDLRNYFDAGTLDNALSSLNTSTGKEALAAEENVRFIKGKPLSSAATSKDKDIAKTSRAIKDSIKKDLADENKKADALKKLQKILKILEEDTDVRKLLTDKEITSSTENGMKIYEKLSEIIDDQNSRGNRNIVGKINQAFIDAGN
jgi:uncharacterized protein YjgD (DUF1641 family)